MGAVSKTMFLVKGDPADIIFACQSTNKEAPSNNKLEWVELSVELQKKLKEVLPKEQQKELGL